MRRNFYDMLDAFCRWYGSGMMICSWYITKPRIVTYSYRITNKPKTKCLWRDDDRRGCAKHLQSVRRYAPHPLPTKGKELSVLRGEIADQGNGGKPPNYARGCQNLAIVLYIPGRCENQSNSPTTSEDSALWLERRKGLYTAPKGVQSRLSVHYRVELPNSLQNTAIRLPINR